MLSEVYRQLQGGDDNAMVDGTGVVISTCMPGLNWPACLSACIQISANAWDGGTNKFYFQLSRLLYNAIFFLNNMKHKK